MENEAFEKFLQTGTIESFLKYKEIQRLNENDDYKFDTQEIGSEEKL